MSDLETLSAFVEMIRDSSYGFYVIAGDRGSGCNVIREAVLRLLAVAEIDIIGLDTPFDRLEDQTGEQRTAMEIRLADCLKIVAKASCPDELTAFGKIINENTRDQMRDLLAERAARNVRVGRGTGLQECVISPEELLTDDQTQVALTLSQFRRVLTTLEAATPSEAYFRLLEIDTELNIEDLKIVIMPADRELAATVSYLLLGHH
jgi:hypothetical protein